MFSSRASRTLICAAQYLNRHGHDWSLIGGAAATFYPIDQALGDDIDIIVDIKTAERIQRDLDLPNQSDQGSDLFRSEIFLRPKFGEMPVDLMAGFQVKRGSEWVFVRPTDLRSVVYSGETIHLPSATDLARIFELCSRPKDLRRAKALRALPDSPA